MVRNVCVLGATGMVGQRFIQLLSQIPDFNIVNVAASKRSVGKRYEDAVTWHQSTPIPEEVKDMKIVDTDPDEVADDVDFVFASLPAELAEPVEVAFAKKFIVASNASVNRMKENIPLVIPEVNPEHLEMMELQKDINGWDGCIVTNPNCSTIALTLTLKPLFDKYDFRRVSVTTMQAISGAGYNGVPSMGILDNIIPYIGSEEEKMQSETLHLLGKAEGGLVKKADFPLSASCNRVGVVDGHTESVAIEFEDDSVTVDDIKETMANYRGLPQKENLSFAPEAPVIVHEEEDRPQPRMDRDAGHGMSVSVGRVREDVFDNSFKYTLVGHNTIRGAAGASILNAQLISKLYL
ncbi:MAG: aspartate-semialdehyde dehydrogenase [Methanosphaera sp.]|nr:aspartate-semialdehyde dehydrogenase [Methanosphaera sp.]